MTLSGHRGRKVLGFKPSRGRRRADEIRATTRAREKVMAESVYKVIELVGTSTESWEKAAKAAVDRAAKSLRDLRVAEIVQQDLQLKNGKVEAYRAKVKVSFKFEGKA
jgi:dodecin